MRDEKMLLTRLFTTIDNRQVLPMALLAYEEAKF